MNRNAKLMSMALVVSLAAISGVAISTTQNKYALKVPGGLTFSEFKGYESWELISVSHNGELMVATVGNPAMINAFKAGIPGNGKPFPDGAKMAKIHWNAKINETWPGKPAVPGDLHDIDFMVKDSKRFLDGGGWGYGAFEFDAKSQAFRPANTNDYPPQANDAKCGVACHTLAKNRDYVFTQYGAR